MQASVVSYIAAFLFPAFVAGIALCYLILRPKPDNRLLGFRTERSLQSPAAWKRAQFLFGRQLLIGAAMAALFGYGFLTVSSVLLKIVLIVLQFLAVAFFGMATEFILRRELGR